MVAVDYVTKWVEAIPTKSADHATAMNMFQDIILPRFGVPRYLITDGGSHFIHGIFRKTLAKYGVNHRVASPYHPQTSGQVELSNRELKLILKRQLTKPGQIGRLKLMMLYGLIGHLIKIQWECLLIEWFMGKLVIFQ